MKTIINIPVTELYRADNQRRRDERIASGNDFRTKKQTLKPNKPIKHRKNIYDMEEV